MVGSCYFKLNSEIFLPTYASTIILLFQALTASGKIPPLTIQGYKI
jgi:hypothetical protein